MTKQSKKTSYWAKSKNADKDIKKIIEIEIEIEATKNMKSDFDNIDFSENALKKARKFIADSEGYRETAYQDTRGVWTIGYGHTKNVKQGDKITKEDAEKFFKEDLEEHIIPLKKVKVPLNDNQKAALASFIYNVGPTAFAKSTLLKKLNNGDIKGASDEFDKWIYDNGTIIDGLINRRKAEKELFLSKEN